ncbi:MAG TPA: hypothetical protein VF069_18715 [Streptosporangiaceae bacterium]
MSAKGRRRARAAKARAHIPAAPRPVAPPAPTEPPIAEVGRHTLTVVPRGVLPPGTTYVPEVWTCDGAAMTPVLGPGTFHRQQVCGTCGESLTALELERTRILPPPPPMGESGWQDWWDAGSVSSG